MTYHRVDGHHYEKLKLYEGLPEKNDNSQYS